MTPSSSPPNDATARRVPPLDLGALLADPTRVAEVPDGRAVQRLLDELLARQEQGQAAERALVRRACFLASTVTTAPRPTPFSVPPRSSPSPLVEWLTVGEVGARLRKSPTTVRRCIKRGTFPGAKKMGAEWRIPQRDVQAYETACPAAEA